MPIYEFECQACGARDERLMRVSDADPTDCLSCGKPALKRLLSAPSFRLSGSGWYETDFKSDKDKKRNLAGGGASDTKPAEAKSESKTESAAPAASTPKSDGAASA